ncbi:organomercurial lyase [Reyranella sp. CPCC 100927]|uniref:organomercurial lyase n=1 Tax=Reyranella sp. CPCC 100927 TaxID=2599616 RepID=UPI0011B58D62|nr:organomercurial lyase [Reyranella sp. CPCC 100927]TWS94119.1 hypothetical protein FQU96_41425 [Reyranella sp. CPCC 100927]
MNMPVPGASLVAALRPGIMRPNWSMITLSGARRTLQRRLEAQPDGVTRWSGLDPDHDHVWQAILSLFRDHGGAPDATAVAQAAGRSREETQRALQALQARDLVVLDAADAAVVAAYPFAGDRTGHQVTFGRRTVNALCAIDALGVGAMCGVDTVITSSCAWCQTPIHVETRDHGLAVRSVTPADAVVLYTLMFDGRAAQSCCPSTVFLCSDAHLDRCANAGHSPSPGDRLTMAEAFEIGAALFGPLLRKHSWPNAHHRRSV